MKRLFFALFVMGLGSSSLAQTKIDTMYYDLNWKGVESRAFASYYRIVSVPNDPNFPKRYRAFSSLTGKIYAEGSAIYIDPYDDSKTVFDGTNTIFYENGKVFQSVTYSNGQLDGPVIVFDENGNTMISGNKKGDLWVGNYQEYHPNGEMAINAVYSEDGIIDGPLTVYNTIGKPLYDGIRKGDLFTGNQYTYYENGELAQVFELKDNKKEGITKTYLQDGSLVSTISFKEDLLDGPSNYYNKNGVVVAESNNIKGLPVGAFISRNGTSTSKVVYKELIPSDGLFGISVGVIPVKYYSDLKTTLYRDKRKPLRGRSDTSVRGKSYDILQFPLVIYSNSQSVRLMDISDVRVEFINNQKASDNMALSEDASIALITATTELFSNAAYTRARSTARNAATTSSSNSSSAFSSQQNYGALNINASAQGSSSVSGAAIAGNSRGQYGYAYGAASGNSSVSGHLSANGNNTTFTSGFGSSNNTVRDGALEYQILQQELEKANETNQQLNDNAELELERVHYSSFTTNPYGQTRKTILAESPASKYDSIRITITIDGKEYSTVWSKTDL